MSVFTPASGRWSTVKVPTKAEVTYTAGMMLYNDGTNNVPCADATQQNVRGIAKEAKASSSTTVSISVLAPQSVGCTFYADVDTGEAITKANEGTPFDFSTGGVTISTASTYDAVTLVKYISANKGIFKLNYTTGVEN